MNSKKIDNIKFEISKIVPRLNEKSHTSLITIIENNLELNEDFIIDDDEQLIINLNVMPNNILFEFYKKMMKILKKQSLSGACEHSNKKI